MSAKRELSSTLKNLKFMQRAVKREEKPPEEEKPNPPPESGFTTPMGRKCIVIMEGNPHPGQVKGRMSFQNFNPSIDRLNQEDSGCKPQTTALSSENTNGDTSRRSEDSSIARPNLFDSDLKRKQPETQNQNLTDANTRENPSPNAEGQYSERRNFCKPQKREKLDYNVLRRQKLEAKKR